MKGVDDIACEESLNVTALLSLSGVGSIMAQNWSTSLTSQQRFISNFYERHMGASASGTFLDAFSAGLSLSTQDIGENTSKRIKLKKWIRFAKVFFGVTQHVRISE